SISERRRSASWYAASSANWERRFSRAPPVAWRSPARARSCSPGRRQSWTKSALRKRRCSASPPEGPARCASAASRRPPRSGAHHLTRACRATPPGKKGELQRLWPTNLTAALGAGDIDVAITCGLIPEPDGIASAIFCAEPLLIGIRPNHRLAERASLAL